MMSSFFDTDFTTQRLVNVSGKSSYSDNASGIGHLRQSSDEVTRLNDLQFGELWELYVEADTDILASDRVLVGSDTYTVKGVKKESFGSVDFKRMLLVKTPV